MSDLYTARIIDGAIEVVLPIPPSVLGHHSGGWRKTGINRKTGRRYVISGQSTAFASVRDDAIKTLRQVSPGDGLQWPAAVMSAEWRFAGTQPDSDGAWTRMSAIRDAAQHTGIVLNDRTVSLGTLTFTRVPRAAQCVVVRFERAESEAAA